MGCGGQSSVKFEAPKNLTLYGHILDNQSRNVMAICRLCSVNCADVTVDYKGNAQQMKSVNMTGHLPMVEEGKYKVYGGNNLIYIFLCKSKPAIGNKMLPADLESNIKGMLGWHQARLMGPCRQLFRVKCDASAFSEKPDSKKTQKWIQDVKDCMKVLDQSLVKRQLPYLCGDKYSLADIVIYNELNMYMKLQNYKWDGPEMDEYPNLSKWATTKIASLDAISQLDARMNEELKKGMIQ